MKQGHNMANLLIFSLSLLLYFCCNNNVNLGKKATTYLKEPMKESIHR